MYNKFNNTIIVDRFEDIPLSELKEGVQIITFDYSSDFSSDTPMDITRTMTLVKKIFSNVFVFQGVINTPCFNSNNDTIECGGYNQKNYHQLFLEVDDRLIELFFIEKSTQYEFCKLNSLISLVIEPSLIKVHENIFDINQNQSIFHNQIKMSEEISLHFLSIPMDEDNCMVFIYEHNIDVEHKFWEVSKRVLFLNREFNAIELTDTEDILLKLSQTSIGKNSNFIFFIEEELFVAKYELGIHLASSQEEQNNALKRIKNVFSTVNSKINIENLFDAYYENKDLKFKAYYGDYKPSHSSSYFIYEEEFIGEGSNIPKEIVDEIRIAKAILTFCILKRYGINPKTGDYYLNNGKIDNSKIVYKDSESILLKNHLTKSRSFGEIYIKIKDYFVLADAKQYPSDEQKINDMFERKSVVDRLVNSK